MRIGIPEANHADVEVEIGDRIYALTHMTRSKQMQLDEAEKALEGAQSTDQVVEHMCGVLSLVLTPTGEQRKPAGELVVKMWHDDKVTVDQIVGLLENVRTAAEARPT